MKNKNEYFSKWLDCPWVAPVELSFKWPLHLFRYDKYISFNSFNYLLRKEEESQFRNRVLIEMMKRIYIRTLSVTRPGNFLRVGTPKARQRTIQIIPKENDWQDNLDLLIH